MLNWLLALLTAALLILAFPKFDLAWLAPVALTPLLVAVAREPRPWRRFLLGWTAGVVYWFGVCYWIQFVLAVHGGMGEAAAWALFALFAVAKALHMGVFALLAGILMRRWWAVPAVAALWVAVEATHGRWVSPGWRWATPASTWAFPCAWRPITGVYGLSFLFVMMAAALALAALRRPRAGIAVAGWPCRSAALLPPPARRAARPRDALLVQPNVSETEEWTPRVLDRMRAGAGSRSPCAACWPRPRNPPSHHGVAGGARAVLLRRGSALPRLCRRPGANHPAPIC